MGISQKPEPNDKGEISPIPIVGIPAGTPLPTTDQEWEEFGAAVREMNTTQKPFILPDSIATRIAEDVARRAAP